MRFLQHHNKKKPAMPKITDQSTAIKELEEIVEHRAELKAVRDAIDSPDEDKDDFD
jgi:hypothetical protein